MIQAGFTANIMGKASLFSETKAKPENLKMILGEKSNLKKVRNLNNQRNSTDKKYAEKKLRKWHRLDMGRKTKWLTQNKQACKITTQILKQ